MARNLAHPPGGERIMNPHLRAFLRFVDETLGDRKDDKRLHLQRALHEILERLVEGQDQFDLPVSAPDGPTWAYALSANLRCALDTPPELAAELLRRPLELADADYVQRVLGPASRP